MKEIEENKKAWGLIAEDHYKAFLNDYRNGTFRFNKIILDELGDISGKKIIHLQCNTGADSIMLTKLGAESVTGVDLVPENVKYAGILADDLGVKNIRFIESDIMKLSEIHHEKYDMVFISEGAIGWLPDFDIWAKTIRKLLKDDGYLYLFDSHPFYLMMDEGKFSNGELIVKYPYFSTKPDSDNFIGGYASESKEHVNYFWMYTVGKIINSLSSASAGMHIEFFNEYTDYICDNGNMKLTDRNTYICDFNDGKFPMSFSLKASVYR